MSDTTLLIILGIIAGVAAVLTRLHPARGYSRRLIATLFFFVVLASAAVMALSLIHTPLVGASGIENH